MQNHKCWSTAPGLCELLLCSDCGGNPVFVICLCFCLDFSIYNCSVQIQKPRKLYTIPECTYGVEGIGCEIVVAVGVG